MENLYYISSVFYILSIINIVILIRTGKALKIKDYRLEVILINIAYMYLVFCFIGHDLMNYNLSWYIWRNIVIGQVVSCLFIVIAFFKNLVRL